ENRRRVKPRRNQTRARRHTPLRSRARLLLALFAPPSPPRAAIGQRPGNRRQQLPTHLGPFPGVERAVVTDHHDSGARGSARGALKRKSMKWFASHKNSFGGSSARCSKKSPTRHKV